MFNVSLPAPSFSSRLPASSSSLTTPPLRQGFYHGGTYRAPATMALYQSSATTRYRQKTVAEKNAEQALRKTAYENRKPDILDRIREKIIHTFILAKGQPLVQQSKLPSNTI
jgi:hypothetical protein